MAILAASAITVSAQTPPTAWARLERLDADGDGKVSRSEFAGPVQMFLRLDQNRDGFITKEEAESVPGQGRSRGGPGTAERKPPGRPGEVLYSRADRNRDGKISAEEWTACFKELDGNGDGFLEPAELEAMWRREGTVESAPAEGGKGPQ